MVQASRILIEDIKIKADFKEDIISLPRMLHKKEIPEF